MAEMATAALAALGMGGAATAGAAAGSSALAALSGLATTVSVIGTLGSALSAASATRDQAKRADLEAGQEKVESVQRETTMKRELMRILGENDVSFAAGGTSTGQGISLTSAKQATKRVNEELTIERDNADFRVALHRARARGLRRRAGSQLFSGLLQGIGQVADFGMGQAEIG